MKRYRAEILSFGYNSVEFIIYFYSGVNNKEFEVMKGRLELPILNTMVDELNKAYEMGKDGY